MTRRTSQQTSLGQALDEIRSLTDNLAEVAARAEMTLEMHVASGAISPLQDDYRGPSSASDHRRSHRPGLPAKIDQDPELRAFILARIDSLTFYQLQDEIAKAFPPDRRVRKSAINDWWNKRRDAQKAKSHPR